MAHHLVTCLRWILLPALFVGCALEPDPGSIVWGGQAEQGGGEAAVEPGAPVGATPAAECPWQSEWIEVWSEEVDHRFSALFLNEQGQALTFGKGDHPDVGWFALSTTPTGSSDVVFWDDITYWRAPIVREVDGGYLLAGTRSATVMSVQRRTPDGALHWETEVRMPDTWTGYSVLGASLLAQAPGGDIVVMGTLDSTSCCAPTLMVSRLTSAGELLWVRTYNDELIAAKDEAYEYPIDAHFDAEGGLVVFAVDFQAGSFDLWSLALDDAGEVRWQTQHPGWERGADMHIVPRTSGGYWVLGTTDSGSAGGPLRVAELDAQGQQTAVHTFGDKDQHVVTDVLAQPDGSVFLTGHDAGVPGPVMWKLDAQLNFTTVAAYDAFHGAVISRLDAMPDGGFLMAGHNYAGFERAGELLRLNADGSIRWRYEMGAERYTNVTDVVVDANGLITVSGSYWDKENHSTGWLMRLNDACR